MRPSYVPEKQSLLNSSWELESILTDDAKADPSQPELVHNLSNCDPAVQNSGTDSEMLQALYQQGNQLGIDSETVDDALEAFGGSYAKVCQRHACTEVFADHTCVGTRIFGTTGATACGAAG